MKKSTLQSIKKKSFVAIALLLLAATNGFSQEKGYVAISLGPSIPIGDFADKDASYENAGFATTGAIFDISFGYTFWEARNGERFGIAALLRGQANGISAEAFEDELYKQTGVTAIVDAKSWSVSSYMIGLYSSYPLSEKWNLDSRIMIGALTAISPDVDVTLPYSSWIKQRNVSNSFSFAYLFGVGVKYDVGKRICLLANVDYSGGKPKMEIETTTSAGGVEKTKGKQSIGAINIGVGVGFRL